MSGRSDLRTMSFLSLVFFAACVAVNTAAAQDATDAVASEDLYKLPDSDDSTDYMNFMMKLLTYEPKTPADVDQYEKLSSKMLDDAARKIISLDRNPESPAFRLAQKYILATKLLSIDAASQEDRQKMIQISRNNLASKLVDQDDIEIALGVVDSLEYIGDLKNARDACQQFSAALLASEDKNFNELGRMLQGTGRRLSLPGQQIQLVGTTYDGAPFNWESYRGKVVLIDFWATWCGPCRAEMPRIAQYYEAYRDRGFEVVGVSVDKDRAKLDAFLQKSPLPWVTLNEGDKKENPTAVHYNIAALPTTILVDRDGRVISLEARGKRLAQLLEQLLGPAGNTP